MNKDIKVYTKVTPPKNLGVLTTYQDQLLGLDELITAHTKRIFFIGPYVDSSPFSHDLFKIWAERFGKPIRRSRESIISSLWFAKKIRMTYFTYHKSLIGLLKPDMIIIINVHLYDVKKWWKNLLENIMPYNKDIPIIYWRW
jgi:hypothetical protein